MKCISMGDEQRYEGQRRPSLPRWATGRGTQVLEGPWKSRGNAAVAGNWGPGSSDSHQPDYRHPDYNDAA